MPYETAYFATGPSTCWQSAWANELLFTLLDQCWLFLSIPQCMALTGEHKILNKIAQGIKIFSIFACLVPTLVQQQNLRFQVCWHTICWLWSINIIEAFNQKKIALSIIAFRSPNCALRKALMYWNRINQSTQINQNGIWEKKYREMEFWPFRNASSPFCR